MKTYVIGDIHGAYRALVQCFERVRFDYKTDHLIALGDVCDGWPEVHLCIEELLKIKHLDYILGNHDQWAIAWAEKGFKQDIWLSQGGLNTLVSYKHKHMPKTHLDFLKKAHPVLELEKRLFVHAGIDPNKNIHAQTMETLLWDRNLIHRAYLLNITNPEFRFRNYDEIFIGHTTTQFFNSDLPLKLCNIWALDTGAGWSGKLTIMDVETKEYWQSDPTPSLYPDQKGRLANSSD